MPSERRTGGSPAAEKDVTAPVDVSMSTGAQVPTGVMGYLRASGPGLLVTMAWLSAGDFISSSVSGATYGYALLWAFVISLLARYFFVSSIGKYVLCNNEDSQSIIAGFGRLWRGLPIVVAVITFILGFSYQTYIVKGAALALYNLTGRIGDSAWGVFVVAVALTGVVIVMVLLGRQYRRLEILARVSVAALLATFFVAVALRGFDPVDLLQGLSFQLPPDAGAFGAVVLTASIIGAVGGSAANLLYPYFMQDKGWRGPRYRRLQVFDLLIGIAAMIVINLSIWIVAAETLPGTGLAIEEASDLALMMERAVGVIGPFLLWIGIFFVTFNSFPAYSYGFTKIFLDGVRHSFPRVVPAHQDLTSLAAFRWIQIGVLLVLPLAFSLPMAPTFVALAVGSTALSAVTAPIIIVGVIVLTTSRRFMLTKYVNRWWETLALLIIGGIGLWATYGVVVGFFG